MADQIENLMLEHLKKFQATLDGMQRDIRELKVRQSDTHAAVLALRRDHLNDAEVTAHLQAQNGSLRRSARSYRAPSRTKRLRGQR